MQDQFDRFYDANPDGFRVALLLARDFMGTYLADTWTALESRSLTYLGIWQALKAADHTISNGRYRTIIDTNFRLREIGQYTPGARRSRP
jgi:hypothetical protein